ncbi:MAG TPA: acetyltransferase [Humisphaera sp.]|jgi:UDP-perosamine 4-acetyltransferase|nr:acetyltransferase [Humisphaera sp.]
MDIVIVGAGGHGKVVLDIIRAEGRHSPIAFVDADTSIAGTRVGGVPVIGAINMLPKLRQQKVRGAIVAIGDNRARLRYAALLAEQGFELVNAIHPAASISATAALGVNLVAAPGAIVCTDARIADSVIINTGAIVDHECQIEAGAHICPSACLGGRVQVGSAAFIGLGAKIIQCLSVGEHAIVGAGAVVIRHVPAHATVVGVPARVIKIDAAAEEPVLQG